MKTSTLSALRPLALAGVSILLLAAAPGRAHAAFTFTLSQVGPNVVVNGTGTLNITALTKATTDELAGIDVSAASLFVGPTGLNTCAKFSGGGLTGPTAYGTGPDTNASAGTGSFVGIFGGGVEAPDNYVSGRQLTDSATFDGQTLATLGFIPGTYVYTWGTGATADSLTITSGVPEPSTWALLGVGLAGLTLALRRRRGLRSVRTP